MVLGIVTGSVPMLFSLLIMQGITLTMWRAFLDKAIPKFEGDKWRKNLDQMSLTNTLSNLGNSLNAASGGAGGGGTNGGIPAGVNSATLATLANQLQSSLPQGQQQQQSSPPVDSTLRSLELLSKLDPSLLKLMDQLTKTQSLQQLAQPANHFMTVPGAPQSSLLNLPGLSNPIPDGGGGGGGAELPNSQPGTMYNDEATTISPAQLQYVQYNPGINDPNGQMKYIEVSSDAAGNPQPQQQQQYELQQPQYQYVQQPEYSPQYVQQSPNQLQQQQQPPEQQQQQQQYVYANSYQNQPESGGYEEQQVQHMPNSENRPSSSSSGYRRRKRPKVTQSDSNDEESEQTDSSEQDPNEELTADNEEEEEEEEGEESETEEGSEDKDAAESNPNMPQVIIGPPLIKRQRQQRNQMRLRKLRKRNRYKQLQLERYLRLSRFKPRGMFGKPRLYRRKRMIYYRPRLIHQEPPEPQSSTTSNAPIMRRNSNMKRRKRKRKRKQHQNKNHSGYGGPYRFATPRYPVGLITPTTTNGRIRGNIDNIRRNNNNDNNNNINNHRMNNHRHNDVNDNHRNHRNYDNTNHHNHIKNHRIHNNNYDNNYQQRALYNDRYHLNLAESVQSQVKHQRRRIDDKDLNLVNGDDQLVEHVSVDMSTDKTKAKVKLKSKMIRLFDDNDDTISTNNNCSATQTQLSSKNANKMFKFWSQNDGWVKSGSSPINNNRKCLPNNVPISRTESNAETNTEEPTTTTEITNVESTTESTATLVEVVTSEHQEEELTTTTTTVAPTTTELPTTTTTTTMATTDAPPLSSPFSLLDIAEILATMTTETPTTEPLTTTTTPAPAPVPAVLTTTPITFNTESFIFNLNNFLKNYATLTTSTTTTTPVPFFRRFPLTTTTESTTISPAATIGSADQLPKEFLDHIMMVINASKIDNFQVNNQPTHLQTDTKNAINSDKNEPSKNRGRENENDEEDDYEDDNDDDEDLDWAKIHKEYDEDENRVDGKIPARHRFKRVCYYLLDGGKMGQLSVDQLELHICSHLIVGYARISGNGLVVVQNPLDDTEKYRRLTQMKFQHPKLKVLLSIGDLGGTLFSIVASTNRTRERFVSSVLDFCNEFNFDGVDIDWEFPSLRSGFKDDKTNFNLLLQELRLRSNQQWKLKRKLRKSQLRRHRLSAKSSTSSHFIISVAVGAPLVIASTSYIIPTIAKNVDFVNLMSYDFHYFRTDSPYTGHHSPLYPRAVDNAYYSTLNVAWAATYWANNGMPLSKIVVGFPTYSRTYNLVVPIGQQMINVPASGPGIGRGKINYTTVCDFLRLPGTVKQFEIHSQVPFAYRNYDWIAYENEMSAAIKAQWVIKTGMGGIVTFALNFDDSKGTCRKDGKRFPLQKTISNLLELASIKSYKESAYVMKVRDNSQYWDSGASGGSI